MEVHRMSNIRYICVITFKLDRLHTPRLVFFINNDKGVQKKKKKKRTFSSDVYYTRTKNHRRPDILM